MFLFSKNKDLKPTRIIPKNNPRRDASLYYTPIFSKELNGIAFTAPYELYFMDLSSKNAELVYSRKGKSDFGLIRINGSRIYFAVNNESKLYSIQLDGSNLKEIQYKLF